MLLWLLRGCFGALIVGMALFVLNFFFKTDEAVNGIVAGVMIVLVGVSVVAADVWERNKQITTVSAVYFGLLLGLLLGWLFSLALEPFLAGFFVDSREMVQLFRLLITVVCCYITISTLLQTKDDFRLIIPYVEFSKQLKGPKPLVLDTSVIIDGRIADICDTRLIDTRLIVPRFVLQELQGIADSSDKLKRNRGRRGLDVLKRLTNNAKLDVEVHEGNLHELRSVQRVDERLVVLAKVVGARLVTNDFNLNKIAQLQGVDVINLNEVANALKTTALPGETMMVRLVKAGDQVGQGVGYLDDGTMVVVEQGKPHIGSEIQIVVTSVLPTQAGRMVFGRPDNRPPLSGSHSGSHAGAPKSTPPDASGRHKAESST